MKHTIIVGAGLAGFSAAVHLAEAGARVTLLEASEHLGGRLSTPHTERFGHDGQIWEFPVEHGIHGYWRQYRNLFALMARQGLDHHLVDSLRQELVIWMEGDRPRFVEVGDRVRDTRIPEPFCLAALMAEREFRHLARKAGPRAMWRMFRDMGHAYAFDSARDLEAYEQLTVGQLIRDWPPFLQAFFRGLTHSGFFIDVEQTSLAAFLTSLQFYTIQDKRDIGFDYLDVDTQTGILGPLRDRIQALGGTVRTRAAVEELQFDGARCTGLRLQNGEVLTADGVVLAVDPPGMTRLRTGPLALLVPEVQVPKGVHSFSARLWFSSRPAPHRATNGMFVGPALDNYFWLSSIAAPYRAFADRTGGSAIEVHLYGDRAEAAREMDDVAVLGRVRRAVETAWPGVRGSCVHAHLQRNPPTHVAFHPGTYAQLPTVQTNVPNLCLAGDWIAGPYPTLYLERATSTGLLAAAQLSNTLGLGAVPEVLPPHAPSRGYRRARLAMRLARELDLLPDLTTRRQVHARPRPTTAPKRRKAS